MIPADLLQAMRCPKDLQQLSLATPELLAKVNRLIARRALQNRAGMVETREIESGLVRADGQVLYPIRDGIAILLIEAGIDLSDID